MDITLRRALSVGAKASKLKRVYCTPIYLLQVVSNLLASSFGGKLSHLGEQSESREARFARLNLILREFTCYRRTAGQKKRTDLHLPSDSNGDFSWTDTIQ